MQEQNVLIVSVCSILLKNTNQKTQKSQMRPKKHKSEFRILKNTNKSPFFVSPKFTKSPLFSPPILLTRLVYVCPQLNSSIRFAAFDSCAKPVWTLDTGHWTLDAGRWTVDGGRWMVDGGWRTVDGGRWMVDGGWWMVDCRQ